MDFNLNPFKREIYCTSYGQGEYRKTSIIIGYEVYIKRAERTGQLDGWQVVTSGSVKNQDLKATITIYRKDRKYPFIHEVDYIEYAQKTFDKKTNTHVINSMWSQKANTMLKKVAMSQGFRLCFADELGGMPYDSSELPGNEEREIIIATQNKKIETIQEPAKQIEKETFVSQEMTSTGHTITVEKSFDDAMLEAQSELIPEVNLEWDQQKEETKKTLVELVGTVATKEETKLYFDSKKNKTDDFITAFSGLELMMQTDGANKGKYLFQPLGTYAASRK
jgi:phage recombination protein Bet